MLLDDENSYAITLHSGWNLISNPFDKSISWSNVQSQNGINENIWDYQGSSTESDNFELYKGYYYYNATGSSSLKIPYISSGSTNSLSKTAENEEMNLSLLSKNGKSSITIGFHEEANSGYDLRDKFSPPDYFDPIKISVLNSDLETEYKYLYSDFRKAIGEGQIYTLQIKNESSESITMMYNGIEVFDSYEVYLIDNNLKPYNLKEVSKLNIPSKSSNLTYVLLVGDEDFINIQKASLLPKEILLKQNYPNPFNPNTTIVYFLPSTLNSSNINLTIYNIMGEKVTTLYEGSQSPGRYEVNFDASNFASGIYYYRLIAGASTGSATKNYVETKKMILLK